MRPTKEVKQYYFSQIERLHRRFSVEWLCELFGVSRSGYYKWKKRGQTLNQYQRSQQILDREILSLHEEHPSSGYRALNARLRRKTGWIVCDLSILHSMQRLHIQAKTRKTRPSPTLGTENPKFPNILNRQFGAEQPLTRIVTDITQFRYQKQTYYFVCYLDLFNNEILEWNVRTDETMQLILPPLRRLLKRKRMSSDCPMLLHSDQGSQYSSAGFHALLKVYNVTQSMSRAGTPHDNAVMESIFGWFKEFLRAEYLNRSNEPVQLLLQNAVFEFNHFRPSFKLHYKSPVQFRIEQGF